MLDKWSVHSVAGGITLSFLTCLIDTRARLNKNKMEDCWHIPARDAQYSLSSRVDRVENCFLRSCEKRFIFHLQPFFRISDIWAYAISTEPNHPHFLYDVILRTALTGIRFPHAFFPERFILTSSIHRCGIHPRHP